MVKKRRSYPKSANIKFDFKPNTTIYEKAIIGNDFKDTIKFEFVPTLPNSPTIESKTIIRNKK